jgi:hypothetical protein
MKKKFWICKRGRVFYALDSDTGEPHRRPELARIAQPEVDLVAPITVAEEEFMLLVIAHFATGWMLAREGSLLTLDVLARDARSFFNLPIPHNVWERTNKERDQEFVAFVESCLANAGA